MQAPKRALFIAPYFLPRRRVGSMRPFRFVIHLREFGWEPVVLTIQAGGQSLTAKEARLLEGIRIVRLEPPLDRTTRSESQLHIKRKSRAGTGYGRRLLDTIDRQFPIDTWLPLFMMKWREISRLVRDIRPDVVWSTGDPWSSLVASERLTRAFDLPWVADFRDPWTLSFMRTEGRWALPRWIDRYYERRVIERADVVLFQAKETERKYRAHYRDLAPITETIYNSYDPDVFEGDVEPGEGTAHPVGTSGPLRIGFFGRFRSFSPATLVASVLEQVRLVDEQALRQMRVESFGALNEQDAAYAEEKGVRTCFHHRDAVPLEKAVSVLREFDILLVSTDTRRDEIIPAKLLEYLAAGRPILSLSRNPELSRILSRTGTGVQMEVEHRDRIADLLIDCLRSKRAGKPLPIPFDPKPDVIRRFDARHTTKELAALFDHAVGIHQERHGGRGH